MAYFWFSGDHHFSHYNKRGTGIIDYCGRPFQNIDEHDEVLVRKHNERVGKDDTIFLLGDFAFKDSGSRLGAQHWLDQLNGKYKYLIKGSHDSNNAVKTIVHKMIIKLGPYWCELVHAPEDFTEPTEHQPIDLHLVAHVHRAWFWRWVGANREHLQINLTGRS